MTKRYVTLAEADIEAQHVAHSPVKKVMKEISGGGEAGCSDISSSVLHHFGHNENK